jgi:hypothetical protein
VIVKVNVLSWLRDCDLIQLAAAVTCMLHLTAVHTVGHFRTSINLSTLYPLHCVQRITYNLLLRRLSLSAETIFREPILTVNSSQHVISER